MSFTDVEFLRAVLRETLIARNEASARLDTFRAATGWDGLADLPLEERAIRRVVVTIRQSMTDVRDELDDAVIDILDLCEKVGVPAAMTEAILAEHPPPDS